MHGARGVDRGRARGRSGRGSRAPRRSTAARPRGSGRRASWRRCCPARTPSRSTASPRSRRTRRFRRRSRGARAPSRALRSGSDRAPFWCGDVRRADQLDRDVALQPLVEREHDHAHAALAERADDAIRVVDQRCRPAGLPRAAPIAVSRRARWCGVDGGRRPGMPAARSWPRNAAGLIGPRSNPLSRRCLASSLRACVAVRRTPQRRRRIQCTPADAVIRALRALHRAARASSWRDTRAVAQSRATGRAVAHICSAA